MTEKLKARLESMAEAHTARAAAVEAARPAHEIAAQAEDHAADIFAGLLANGHDVDDAMTRALAEAERQATHLTATAVAHADPAVPMVELACAACEDVTPHALVVDGYGESVATCLCGRFRKFAAGEPVA